MIELLNVTKRFEDKEALKDVSLKFEKGFIYGLVGTNGSGKSTMLRLISGVYKPEEGSCVLEDENVFNCSSAKEKVFFISDDLYFAPNATIKSMASFYKSAYTTWSDERFKKLCSVFPLDINKKLSAFSKGMRRQAAFILALSSKPSYLLLDEAFDGIDPVIRHGVRQLISDILAEDNICCIISSHNLRELEDFCDRICLLHDGKLLMDCSLDKVSSDYCKLQVAFKDKRQEIKFDGIKILSQKARGSVITVICNTSEENALKNLNSDETIFAEAVPLTLEELFIYEMEAIGYDYSKIIF